MFDSNLPYYDQYDNNEAQLLNFNSRMLDNDDLFLDTILLPYQPPPPPPPPQPPLSTTSKKGLEKGMKKKQDHGGGSHSKGRKTGKKDRHSKIYTAQGPRDRRMRLSLQIARKFFDLQDMLGFDKASKTIEWLFNKSRAAIKDLSEKSLIIPNSSPLIGNEKNEENKCEKKSSKIKNGGKKEKIMSKLNEKRKEARARARERTKEKLKMKQKNGNKKLDLIMEKNPNNESISQEKVLEDQMACVGIVEKFLGASSSSSMVNYNSQDNDLNLGFSMEYPRSERSTNGGFMEGTLEYVHQVDQVGPNPNCAFMGRGFNQGY